MKLEIKCQESYSRGELILRTLFGWIYIAIPHMFLLFFMGLWGSILQFISWWIILFTGRYPQSFFEFQVKLMRWSTRVLARQLNLSDDYPAFGLDAQDEYTNVEVAYPESLSRGTLLLKTFFGWLYVGLPHGFMLYFRALATYFVTFIAWWVILFTGKYPESWHRFNVGTLRWAMRVNLYMSYMTDDYPPFSGRPDEEINPQLAMPKNEGQA